MAIVKDDFRSDRRPGKNWRPLLICLTFLATLMGLAGSSEAQTCPTQFSGATYDVRFTLNSTHNYFRRATNGVYCKVNVDRSRGVATTIRSSIVERQQDGDYVLFNAAGGGKWYEWLLIRITNSNCGRELDLFGRNQIKFCTKVYRRSGDRWVQPRDSWGHWVRNVANRPPNAPSGLRPSSDSMTSTSPTLRWTNNGDPDRDRVYFHVRVWVWQSGGWRQTLSTNVNGTSYVLRGLPRGAYVYWRVWASDGKGWSRPVSARFRT